MPRRGEARVERRGQGNHVALSAPGLVEHFFRREYGRLVAVLSRRAGVHHIAAVEDAVQFALIRALEIWTVAGLPDNPSGWLYRVAGNALIGELRQQSDRRRILHQSADEIGIAADDHIEENAGDDLLHMLFVCCDDTMPVESQVVLALKTLCGFSVREIALRLLINETNVYKRLGRARQHLRQGRPPLGDLEAGQYAARLPGVHRVLYVLFAEGYLSSSADFAIRRDLCEEAVRLATLLAEHPVGAVPETAALLALMHLHAARMTARQDRSGGLLLLEEQDRSLWDRDRIGIGLEWLAKSATGIHLSRYHAEAGIAAEHCLAPSFAQTRWDRVVECYGLLQHIATSPIHRLNQAIAIAELQGPAAALASLDGLDPEDAPGAAYLRAAVMSDLNRRCGHREAADRFRDQALRSAPTLAVRTLLERRLRPDGIEAGMVPGLT